MSTRLLRWLFIHCFLASLPVVTSYVVYSLFPSDGADWHLNVGEVLFFTFMISAIALGDVVELVIEMVRCRERVQFLVVLSAILLAGVLYSLLLYGMNVHHNTHGGGEAGGSDILLQHSVFLALVFFILGTLVQVMFSQAEGRIWRRLC